MPETDIAVRQAETEISLIEDRILEEKVADLHSLAVAFGKTLPEMKRLLAENYEKLFEVQRKAGLTELNITETRMLNDIIEARVESQVQCPHSYKKFGSKTAPTPRLRAAKRLREIYQGAKSNAPIVNVNTQINNNFPDGTIETFMRKIDEK